MFGYVIGGAAIVFYGITCLWRIHRASTSQGSRLLHDDRPRERPTHEGCLSAKIPRTEAKIFLLERVTGIEPAWPAWKAGALPLSYTREVVPKPKGFVTGANDIG